MSDAKRVIFRKLTIDAASGSWLDARAFDVVPFAPTHLDAPEPAVETHPWEVAHDPRDGADVTVEPDPFDSPSRTIAALPPEDTREGPPTDGKGRLVPRKTPPPGSTSMPPPAPPFDGRLVPALADLELRTKAFAEAAIELGAVRNRIVLQAQEDLLTLAVEIARSLVEVELSSRPELTTTLVRAAVDALGATDEATIRVSKEAYAAILGLHQDQSVIEVDGTRVHVTLDATLEGLGCIAESAQARVDGRVQERLRAVLDAMRDEHRRRQEEPT